MIVVPSIPIRHGVNKSIEMLDEHFRADYSNISLIECSVVYDSKDFQSVRSKFLENDDLRILIINKDSFNKISNKINQEDEQGRVLLNDIRDIRPIVIIDEPQKLEGSKNEASKTKNKLKELTPLFTIKYSATHRIIENLVYKLDSYKSSKNGIIKSISVNTIYAKLPPETDYIKYLGMTSSLNAKLEILYKGEGAKTRKKTIEVDSTS